MNIFPFKAEEEVGVVTAASSRTCRMGGPQEVDREPQDSRGSHRGSEMERVRSPPPQTTRTTSKGRHHMGRNRSHSPGGGALRQLPVELVADGRWEEETRVTKNRTRDGGSPCSSLGRSVPPP